MNKKWNWSFLRKYYLYFQVDGYISVTHKKDEKHTKTDVLKSRIVSNQYYFIRLTATKAGSSLQIDNEEFDLDLGEFDCNKL